MYLDLMITRDNLKEVIHQIDENRKKTILNSDKEYCALFLHIFNTGSYTEAICTNNYEKFKNISNNGNAILPIEEVQEILKEKREP